LRTYRGQKNSNYSEELFREMDRLRDQTKEVLMFISILSEIVMNSNKQAFK